MILKRGKLTVGTVEGKPTIVIKGKTELDYDDVKWLQSVALPAILVAKRFGGKT